MLLKEQSIRQNSWVNLNPLFHFRGSSEDGTLPCGTFLFLRGQSLNQQPRVSLAGKGGAPTRFALSRFLSRHLQTPVFPTNSEHHMLQRNEKEILQAHLIFKCKHKVSIICNGKAPKDKRKTWNILFCWRTIMSITSGTQQLMIWKPKFLPVQKESLKRKEKKKMKKERKRNNRKDWREGYTR